MATQAAPTFSPVAGMYQGTQSVTIASASATTIYYTTDGTIPSTSSTVYSAPVSVSTDSTLRAFAVKSGVFNSLVASADYQINQTVVAWKTNEGTGTNVTDYSGNSNTLAVTSGAWSGSIPPLPNAITYDGSTTHSAVAASSIANFDGSKPFSIVAWFKLNAYGVSEAILSKLNPASNFQGWELACQGISPSSHFDFFLVNTYTTNCIDQSTTTTFTTGGLHQVIVTYDGSKNASGVAFYLDGAVMTKAAPGFNNLTGSSANSIILQVGQRTDGTTKLTANLGATYLFNRVLTAREIAKLFANAYIPGTTYYVSATGSDSADGLTTGTPWQTITKVNAHTFLPGDTMLFHGGDTFTGPLTLSLQGTADFPITISSYGSGNATINGGSGAGLTINPGNAISTGVGDGIDLTDSENFVIQNLNIVGSGWTGTPPSITVTNYACGIQHVCTKTTGAQLVNAKILNCNISGFAIGVNIYASSSNTIVGFNGITVSGCNISSNLVYGILALGNGNGAGGAVNRLQNVYIGSNTFTNYPGNPNGGANGAPAGGTQAINTGEITTGQIVYNYINEGGFSTGADLNGGSGSLVVSNSRSVQVIGNEVTATTNFGKFDGCAIDLDQDCQNCTVAYNLTYNNSGPGLQLGSFGGKTTQNNSFHHNISWNDVRGTSTGAPPEQGAIRFFGHAPSNFFFNNTIYVGAGTIGTPSCVNFEVGTQDGNIFSNNLMKTVGGIPFFHSNTVLNATHMGSQTIVGNVYDSSSGALVISNDNGTTTGNITTLAAWQAAGFELLGGVTPEGSTGNSKMSNPSALNPPGTGFINNGGLRAVRNFDLLAGSAAIDIGIDTSAVAGGPTLIGLEDWHAFTISGAPFNIGALESTGDAPAGTTGKGTLLLMGVGT